MQKVVGSNPIIRSLGHAPTRDLLAMAMFVFVIEMSLMNVSISAVVRDLETTVSVVQGRSPWEVLVSAAFILIAAKSATHRPKRATRSGLALYELGDRDGVRSGPGCYHCLLGVRSGARCVVDLPAMSPLSSGSFEGKMRRGSSRRSASGRHPAAIGPLIVGFLTMLLSWRVGFAARGDDIPPTFSGPGRSARCRSWAIGCVDVVGPILSVLGMSLLVLGVLVGRRAASRLLLCPPRASGLGDVVWWLSGVSARARLCCSIRTLSRRSSLASG